MIKVRIGLRPVFRIFAPVILAAVCLCAHPVRGQRAQAVRAEGGVSVADFPAVRYAADSVGTGIRVLDEVVVVGNYAPLSYEDRWRLKRRVKKVWPYAVLASQYLYEMDSLRQELSRRKFKTAVNRRQKELFDNFSGILKKFTRSEGKVLIKLVYRQTGNSAYGIARELKGGVKAFFWNTSAGMFSLSLKDGYDPAGCSEDYHIENILGECFASGELTDYPAYNEWSSPFYYRKIEQDIARSRQESELAEKMEKKRERQVRRMRREDASSQDGADAGN